MFKTKCILLLVFCWGIKTNAQDIFMDTLVSVEDSSGYIVLDVDSSIVKLEADRKEGRTPYPGCGPGHGLFINGYRILLGFDQDRKVATELLQKAKVLSHSCKLEYDEPNFKVYMGEFVEYSEAVKVLKTAQKLYPLAKLTEDKIKAPIDHFKPNDEE